MKKKPLIGLAIFVLGYLAYGIVISGYQANIIAKELEPDNPEGFYDYSGVTNVHTTLSSGSGTLEQVIEAAQESGLDFISFSDLNLFDKPSDIEGYHDNIFVFVDGEYSYLDSRLLNYDARSGKHLKGLGQSQALFADLLSQKDRDPDSGLLVLAHPFKTGFKWSGKYPAGLDGIEIINLKSLWRKAFLNSRLSFFWTFLIYPFNSELASIRLISMPEAELRLWDRLNSSRPTLGFAGTDADAKIKLLGLNAKVPSYEVLFGIVQNHILLKSELTGNAKDDRNKITQALRNGHFYMSFDILGNPKGFLTTIRDNKGRVFPMGSKLKWENGQQLVVHLPQKPMVPFDVMIFKDGEQMMISNSQTSHFNIHSPGTYRVVVRVIPTFPLPDGKKWVPWIFSNPFHITSAP